jgi:[acyl-carrier-protein] S-malonyltransferase
MMKKVAFIFPGQGSQSFGMGQDFYNNYEVAKEMIDRASEETGIDFKALMFSENENLEQTEYTQPAILLVSAVAHRLFENEMSIKPQFALGHSLGEFSALVSVGALDYIDAVKLVHHRGRFMKEACAGKGAGMMALLGLDDGVVEEMTKKMRDEGKQIWAANYNSDGQIVVAGVKADLEATADLFKEEGAKRAIVLPMSVASHCPILTPAVEQLSTLLGDAIKEEFAAPVISNVTAAAYDSKAEALELLPDQLVKPVKYKQSVNLFECEVEAFVELGGNVLKGINRKVTKVPTISITDGASLQKAVEELA